MPATNGQDEGVVLVQAGSPISSFDPAIRLREFVGFWARLGSFCLLVGNGPGKTWLTWTFDTDVACAAGPRTTIAASVLTAMVVLGPAAHATSVSNVQVNQVFPGPFPTNKQNEPSLAQNPTNSLNLIAGSNDEIGEPACTNTTPSSCPFVAGISVSGFYASSDGGQTWPCQGLIDLSAFHEYGFGDPAQAFDSQGNAYYGGLAFPNPPTTAEVATGQQADFFIAKS